MYKYTFAYFPHPPPTFLGAFKYFSTPSKSLSMFSLYFRSRISPAPCKSIRHPKNYSLAIRPWLQSLKIKTLHKGVVYYSSFHSFNFIGNFVAVGCSFVYQYKPIDRYILRMSRQFVYLWSTDVSFLSDYSYIHTSISVICLLSP